MSEAALLQQYLMVGAVMFTCGVVGFLTRRNMILMFLCAELMLQGVSVSLAAWSRYHNDWGGQMLVVFILAVAACEAAIALAMVLLLVRSRGTLDIAAWQELRDENQPRYVDQRIPEDLPEQDRFWPTLSPAGREPAVDEEALAHRDRV